MNAGFRSLLLLGGAAGCFALASCATPDTASAVEGVPGSEGVMVQTTRHSGGGGTRTSYEMTGDVEGIMNRGGRLYYVKDRGTTLLTREGRVTEEFTLERNQMVSYTDGRRFRVRDGYILTRGGEMLEVPPYLR